MVTAFAPNAISRYSLGSATGVTQVVVCVILFWDDAYKRALAAI